MRPSVGWMLAAIVIVIVIVVAASCSSEEPAPSPPPPAHGGLASMLDSATCGGCHRRQYEEWAGSMHAYAADDPVFRALNEQLRAEVPEEQKTFCLKCHAPMAVKLGGATDLAALDATPSRKGVTCVFCHAAESFSGTNNNPLVLGEPPVMGAAIHDPVDPIVHRAAYRPLLDGESEVQSGLCGPCHDIVALGGAHIERTFREWSQSRFGIGEQKKTSCANCHMPVREEPAAEVAGKVLPVRKVHDHSMVGVDLALTPFPGKEAQRAKVQASLDDAIDARLCVESSGAGAVIDVALENRRVGHAWPSGSNQDRRAWIEITAYAAGAVLLESGHIPDGTAVSSQSQDASLFLLRDHDFDVAGQETELFWRAASFTSKQISPARATSAPFADAMHAKYTLASPPDRVVMAVKIRPIDADVLEAARAGGLDLKAIDAVSTFTLAKTKLEWTASLAEPCVN